MGKLLFEGPARIDGQVDGEISANDVLVIGESAVVTAKLNAVSVVIAGRFSGDIIAGKRVEIRPTAKVCQTLAVGAESSLGRRVGQRRIGERQTMRDGVDVNDHPRPAFDHAGKEGAVEANGHQQVKFQYFFANPRPRALRT